MGFGGAALAANQQIRNNRNLLKSKRKIGELSFVSSVDEKWVDPNRATFDQLIEIRRRLARDRKVELKKLIGFSFLGFTLLIMVTALIPWELIFKNCALT